MSKAYRRYQIILTIISVIIIGILSFLFINDDSKPLFNNKETNETSEFLAIDELEKLEIKKHHSSSKYIRNEFGSGWSKWSDCDTRQKILSRDLINISYNKDNCTVLKGDLNDPYTGKIINFVRGVGTSTAVQIDHVVALSNAWNTGASYWDKSRRIEFANDGLELLAVDGPSNNQKSAKDASMWLPSNTDFRCQYVARQIAIKVKYILWVTQDEYKAMKNVLQTCPTQLIPEA